MVEVSVLCPETPATVRRLFLPVCVRMLTSLGARLDEGGEKKKERGRITNHLGIKLRVSTVWWETEAKRLSRTLTFYFILCTYFIFVLFFLSAVIKLCATWLRGSGKEKAISVEICMYPRLTAYLSDCTSTRSYKSLSVKSLMWNQPDPDPSLRLMF